MIFCTKRKKDGTIELQRGIVVNIPQHCTHLCLFIYHCENTDSDHNINSKWESFKKDAKESPNEKITFINDKNHKAYVAFDGEIKEIKYKNENGTIPTDTIINTLRELLEPKNELKMLLALNYYLQGNESWDTIFQQEKKLLEKEIKKIDMGHLPLHNYKIEKGRDLYDFLRNNEYISRNTSIENFLYILGFTDEKPHTPQSIQWIKTKELLSVLLFDLLYAEQINTKCIKKSSLENMVQTCFTYRDGKKMELAKRKEEQSPFVELLKNYFATNFR